MLELVGTCGESKSNILRELDRFGVVVIPDMVTAELDSMKNSKKHLIRAFRARCIARMVLELGTPDQDRRRTLTLGQGQGQLKFVGLADYSRRCLSKFPPEWSLEKHDHAILAVTFLLGRTNKKIVLITEDKFMRIKCGKLNLVALNLVEALAQCNGASKSIPPLSRNQTTLTYSTAEDPEHSPEVAPKPKYRGTCIWFTDAINFGFIRTPSVEKDLFVHRSGLLERIEKDDTVQFHVSNRNGRPCAIDVEVLVRCSPINAPLSRTDEQLLTDDASERLSKLRKRKMEAEAEGEPRPKRQRFTYLKATPNERAFGKVFLNVFIVCFNADKRKKKKLQTGGSWLHGGFCLCQGIITGRALSCAVYAIKLPVSCLKNFKQMEPVQGSLLQLTFPEL